MKKTLLTRIRRFRRAEDGATLIELAVTYPLFLLILFALVDFGRMGYNFVTAEKAMQIAARTAAVRPPACPGVPNTHQPAGLTPPPRYGAFCGGGSCVNPGNFTCVGSGANPTAAEVWARIAPLMPNNATIANVQFRYEFDANIGFVGGPYTPIVTAEVVNLNFNFVLPIGALGNFITGNNNFANTFVFPNVSNSMPAEDLNQGTAG